MEQARARRAGSGASSPQSAQSAQSDSGHSAFSSVPTSAYMTPDQTPRKEPASRAGSGPSPLRPPYIDATGQHPGSLHGPAGPQDSSPAAHHALTDQADRGSWSHQRDHSERSWAGPRDDAEGSQAAEPAFQSMHGGGQHGASRQLQAVSPLQAARSSSGSPPMHGSRAIEAEPEPSSVASSPVQQVLGATLPMPVSAASFWARKTALLPGCMLHS